MLTIRDSQLSKLGERHQDAFVEKAMELLRENWPKTCAPLPEEELRARVTAGVEEARLAGFPRSQETLRYLNLTFALGPGFVHNPSYPWAQRICADTAVQADERMDRLVQKATFQLEGRKVV